MMESLVNSNNLMKRNRDVTVDTTHHIIDDPQMANAFMVEALHNGKENANQLRKHLLLDAVDVEKKDDDSVQSQDKTRLLIGNILKSYETAMSLAPSMVASAATGNIVNGFVLDQNYSTPAAAVLNNSQFAAAAAAAAANGNDNHGSSSWNETTSDHHNTRPQNNYETDCQVSNSKKRNTMPRWTETVTVPSGSVSGLDGPLNDGISWRKYGQKNILGATYPRGYYRCTHQKSQGCAATKQVQKSDEDPNTYLVIYRGHHTCSGVSRSPQTGSCRSDQSPLSNRRGPNTNPPAANHEPSVIMFKTEQTTSANSHKSHQQQQQQQLPAQLKIKSEEPKTKSVTTADHHQQQQQQQHQFMTSVDHLGQKIFRNYSFSSSARVLNNATLDNYMLTEAAHDSDNPATPFLGTLSVAVPPGFGSSDPENSMNSSYNLSPSPYHLNNNTTAGSARGFHGQASDSSVTNSPTGGSGTDFDIDDFGFDLGFEPTLQTSWLELQ